MTTLTTEGCEANGALTAERITLGMNYGDLSRAVTVNSVHEDYFWVLDHCFHIPTHLSRNLFLQVFSLR